MASTPRSPPLPAALPPIGRCSCSKRAGQHYIIAFGATASAARPLRVVLQQSTSSFAVLWSQTVTLTPSWHPFTYTYTPTGTQATVLLGFNLAASTGQVWRDLPALTKAGIDCLSAAWGADSGDPGGTQALQQALEHAPEQTRAVVLQGLRALAQWQEEQQGRP